MRRRDNGRRSSSEAIACGESVKRPNRIAAVGRSKASIAMSNTAVGPVYETIIQEVINAVRVDFEENGVDDGVLEDLKRVRRSIPPSLSRCIHLFALHSRFPSLSTRDPPPHSQLAASHLSIVLFLMLRFYFPLLFPPAGVERGNQLATGVGLCLGRMLMTPGERGGEQRPPSGRPSTFGLF